jgi:hypothetical protein
MKILSWDVGIYNLSYCILETQSILETQEKPNEIIKILDWDIINLVENDVMKKNRTLVFENIPLKLNEKKQLLDVDIVIIENQPCLKNPQMKSIQMILYSYFIILGKTSSFYNDNSPKIKKIDFCSASNKLKIYDGPEIILSNKNKKIVEEKIDTKKSKIKYSDKKKLAIEYTKYFLNKPETISHEYTDFFNNHKKKDDLADSFLQGLYYIKKM